MGHHNECIASKYAYQAAEWRGIRDGSLGLSKHFGNASYQRHCNDWRQYAAGSWKRDNRNRDELRIVLCRQCLDVCYALADIKYTHSTRNGDLG